MKLTESKIKWIKNRVNYYCKLLEVEEPPLILTRKDYEEMKAKRRAINQHYRGRNFSRFLGVCHGNVTYQGVNKDYVLVALNVKKHYNLKQLDETIRHELIHYSKPSYNHRSFIFYDRMYRLLKGRVNEQGRFN